MKVILRMNYKYVIYWNFLVLLIPCLCHFCLSLFKEGRYFLHCIRTEMFRKVKYFDQSLQVNKVWFVPEPRSSDFWTPCIFSNVRDIFERWWVGCINIRVSAEFLNDFRKNYLNIPSLTVWEKFSISNNRSSDKPHWLWYCHCAKLHSLFNMTFLRMSSKEWPSLVKALSW